MRFLAILALVPALVLAENGCVCTANTNGFPFCECVTGHSCAGLDGIIDADNSFTVGRPLET